MKPFYLFVFLVMSLPGIDRSQTTQPQANVKTPHYGVIDVDKTDLATLGHGSNSIFAAPKGIYYNFHLQDLHGFRFDPVHKGKQTSRLLEPDPKHDYTVTYTYAGKEYTLDDYCQRNNVLGLLVLHGHQIECERYFHGASKTSHFISHSMAKSLLSIMVGIAIEEGKMKLDAPVTDYLPPSYRESGFRGRTVKQCLQMSTALDWDENYNGPNNGHDSIGALIGEAGLHGSFSVTEAAAHVKADPLKKPGTEFNYQTINAIVLSLALQKATGIKLNTYLEEKVWKKMGAASDGFYYCHRKQPDITSAGGFSATTRDYARFGLMVCQGGMLQGQRVISEAWIRACYSPEETFCQPPRPKDFIGAWDGYNNFWWLPESRPHVLMAEGVFGQTIYIDRDRDLVIVLNSCWKDPDTDAGWNEMRALTDGISNKYPTKPDTQ